MTRTRNIILLGLAVLVLSLALPAVARADVSANGWTWDENSAQVPAPDGWTWEA